MLAKWNGLRKRDFCAKKIMEKNLSNQTFELKTEEITIKPSFGIFSKTKVKIEFKIYCKYKHMQMYNKLSCLQIL
jgi:hypothetical protein